MIIGLTGKARAGKDTASAMIEESLYDKEVAVTSFAAPLKTGAQALLGLSYSQLWGDEKDTPIDWLGVTPRRVLQTLGTEWGRYVIDQDIWVKVGMQNAKRLSEEGSDIVVFTDVRFDNEARAIRDNGGHVFEIFRPGNQAVESHASESGVDPALVTSKVMNHGSLEEFQSNVVKYILGAL